MKKLIILLTLNLIFSVAQAEQVADDFERADQAYTGDIGTTFGSGWYAGNTDTTADLVDGEVVVTGIASAQQAFSMLRNDILTENAGNNSFTISCVARIDQESGGSWAGVTFNRADGNNFYVFRYSITGNVQFLAVAGGSIVSVPVNVGIGYFTHVQNRKYEVTVSSSDPYTFECSLVDTTDSSVVWSGTVTDAGSRFSDGKGGLWANNLQTCFDEFSLGVIQAPVTIGVLGCVTCPVGLGRH